MPNIAIFKSEDNLSYYEDYTKYLVPAVSEWQELSPVDLEKLRDSINLWNRNGGQGYFILVEETNFQEELPVLYKNAEDFYKKVQAQEEKRAKQAAIEKAKRDAKAQERKRKQLEKLKLELEG